MRAAKSPRRTAVRTRSVTFGSMPGAVFVRLDAFLTALFVAISFVSFPSSIAAVRSFGASLIERDPEFNLCSRARLAFDLTPPAGKLCTFSHCEQAEVAWQVH
jgi:hypothetical protein